MKYSERLRKSVVDTDEVTEFFAKSLRSTIRGTVRLQETEYPYVQWTDEQCTSKLLAIDTETTVVESRG